MRAAALATLAALTMHPLDQLGEECLYGHHRVALLQKGFFGSVLQSMLPAVANGRAAELVGECASVTLMNMSTMVSSGSGSESLERDPRQQQIWIVRGPQGGRAHPLAACGVATLETDTRNPKRR